MHGAAAETVAVVLLTVALAFAVARPRGLSELLVAGPAAVLAVAVGIVPVSAATKTMRELGPTIGFLAAILLFGRLCADAQVFRYLGTVAARRSRGDSRRLLALVVVLAAVVTATLTLDATVVLVTPVVVSTVRRLHIPARPHVYACARLANSGSLVLPVSNLTNLLAFGASGLTFGRFTALMALPWLVACAGEWTALRTWFRRDLTGGSDATLAGPATPRYALAVLLGTVALFPISSSLGIAPAWAAVLGCGALLVPRLRHRDVRVGRLIAATSPGFCLFVFALAVVVDGVTRHGLGHLLSRLLPTGTSLLSLLAIAFLAAGVANVLNNLPATLALAPIAAAHPAAVLAVLVGVNIGPNATYPGSLATLLWRRLLPIGERPAARTFHALGLLTVPLLLGATTLALWLAVTTLGT